MRDSQLETYVAMSGPGLSRKAAVRIANSMAVGLVAPLEKAATPAEGSAEAKQALEHWMAARLARRDLDVLAGLRDELRQRIDPGAARLLQVSNPCWYRWVLQQGPRRHTPTQYSVLVRLYEHSCSGDVAGGPPRSWRQEVGLSRASGAWRIDRIGSPTDERLEMTDPHGPTQSACATRAS
jgi:hypothetical protein